MGQSAIREKTFQTFVLKRLRALPFSWWVKVNDRCTVGVPDILGCVAGTFFALELKTSSKLSQVQIYTLLKISRAAGRAYEVNPGNFELIFSEIRQLALSGCSDDH